MLFSVFDCFSVFSFEKIRFSLINSVWFHVILYNYINGCMRDITVTGWLSEWEKKNYYQSEKPKRGTHLNSNNFQYCKRHVCEYWEISVPFNLIHLLFFHVVICFLVIWHSCISHRSLPQFDIILFFRRNREKSIKFFFWLPLFLLSVRRLSP